MTTAQGYLRFAGVEARGSSPTYERLAEAVAASPDVLALLDRLPVGRRQPNLLFGVGRLLGAPVEDPDRFTAWVVRHWDTIRGEVLDRSTQTNEPARCATLLPVLAALPGPLALLEVGASAGLCLYPDRYRYDYGTSLVGPDSAALTLTCALDNAAPLPTDVPEVVWRAGIDLNPLDVTRDESLAWLEALVWPEHGARRERLRAASRVVREDPPLLAAGDLNEGLSAVAARAPAEATLVVFHSAVLAYLDEAARVRFAEAVRQLPGHWVANEAPHVLEGLVRAPALPAPEPGRFLLTLDGVPKAWTGPHGQSLFWLD